MPLLGEIFALLTALLWSATSLIFAEAANRIGSIQLNINRLIFALVILSVAIFSFQIEIALTSTQLIYLAISGIIGLVIGDHFLFKAYQHIGPRFTMLLMALSPGLTAIFGIFLFNEFLSLWGTLGVLITLAGIALVILEKKEIPNAKYKISRVGILFGIIAAIGQSVGLIFAKFAFEISYVNGFTAAFYRIFFSVILLFPFLILLRKYHNPILLYKKDIKALWLTIAGSIVGPVLGISFSMIAITYTKIGIAATLMSTMPIIMVPMIIFIYKEKISSRSILGAVIAVAGIAILFLK